MKAKDLKHSYKSVLDKLLDINRMNTKNDLGILAKHLLLWYLRVICINFLNLYIKLIDYYVLRGTHILVKSYIYLASYIIDIASGHTKSKAPDPFRTPKLSDLRRG